MAGGQVKIESMYAFIVLDPADNTEGIPALNSPDGPLPMVGADMARIEQLRPWAEHIASTMGAKVTLAHFTNRTDVETIGEDSGPATQ
jgi:hypothetical protein